MKKRTNNKKSYRRKKVNIDTKLKSAIRRIWGWYGENKKNALARSKLYGKIHECEKCGAETEKPEADHVIPVSVFKNNWNSYIEAMFYGDIQVLCRDCHAEKTIIDNRKVKEIDRENN